MNEAIDKARCAKFLWIEYEKYFKENNTVKAGIKMRDSDQHYGYAEGIYHVLNMLNFMHDGMKELSDLL